MSITKINKVKKEIENLSSSLTANTAQKIFYDIIFRKKVDEGLKDVDNEIAADWKDFKKEIKSWYKSK
jgi:hypothetical protein